MILNKYSVIILLYSHKQTSMDDFWGKLFSPEGFMPHGHCYLWQSEVLWSNVIGDGVIALAYFAIPITLAVFTKQRPNPQLRRVIWLFAIFILACGMTHVIDIITVWQPAYRIEGVVKIFTAVVSVLTAGYLWVLLPVAKNLPSPGMFNQTKLELQEANVALNQKIRELEITKRELENFAYTVSHNLRSPVRHLIAYSDLLTENLSEETISETNYSYLEAVNTSSHHMGKLVDDLLGYMKTGRMEVKYEPLEMGKIVEQVIPILEQGYDNIPEWKIGPLPTIYADERMMRQLWQNLLENAVKFSSKEEKPTISLMTEEKSGGWEFVLKDNGAGFNEERKEKIFQIFERLHRQSEYSGTGIGLAQVSQIVEKHHGRISAESPSNQKGSIFRVWIPAKR